MCVNVCAILKAIGVETNNINNEFNKQQWNNLVHNPKQNLYNRFEYPMKCKITNS